jgi:prepilin-type N-terminal cleavage/methylation domain-containing protein/prepilin-type processing-associated H-X9-DG protein
MKTRAFTLIELLVVLAIIVILASLLLPTISRTKESGRSAVCLNNLHQIGLGLQLYVDENQNRLPVMYDRPPSNPATSIASIDVVLLPQVRLPKLFQCPSDRQRLFEVTGSSYSWNSMLNGQDADHLQLMTNPVPLSMIFLVFDKEKFHIVRGEKKAMNFLYADGHIRNLMELQSAQ